MEILRNSIAALYLNQGDIDEVFVIESQIFGVTTILNSRTRWRIKTGDQHIHKEMENNITFRLLAILQKIFSSNPEIQSKIGCKNVHPMEKWGVKSKYWV